MATAIDDLIKNALQFQRSGQLEQAIQIYQQVLAKHPNHSHASTLLSVIYTSQGRSDLATDLLKGLVAAEPQSPQAWLNYGFALKSGGRLEEAINAYQKALQLKPDYFVAHFNLAAIYEMQQKKETAINCYRAAIKINPTYADARTNLASVYENSGEHEQLLQCARDNLAALPESIVMACGVASALTNLDQYDEAEQYFQRASTKLQASTPKDASVFFHALAINRLNRLNLREAMQYITKGLDLDPASTKQHWFLAEMYLRTGEYSKGWREYEYRVKDPTYKGNVPLWNRPIWDGSSLSGKTICMYMEQGLGDTIQFMRYAQLASKVAKSVILIVQPELVEIAATMPGPSLVLPKDGVPPDFDVMIPLLSMPARMQTTLETIPAKVPYINTKPEWHRCDAVKQIDKNNGKLNVGLVWAGNPKHLNDRKRSIVLKLFTPMLQLSNCNFYSLQKNFGLDQLAQLPAEIRPMDLDPYLHSFKDTCAVLDELDLLITVDTSVAHLAGAMGRKTWTLLPLNPDFRWMLDRTDSPWYPTMKLWRQDKLNDWPSVIEKITAALADYVG